MEPGLIVNADDVGIHPATTRGIASAYQNGIVSSASVMVTMPMVEDAVTAARTAAVPLGLHVSLTQGRAVTGPRMSGLIDETGSFISRPQHLFRVRRSDNALVEQIRIEIRAQLAKARDLGLTLTHVDSHHHVHMNPVLFAILEQEASTFGVLRIRFSREPLGIFWHGGRYAEVLRRNNLSKWLIVRALSSRINPQLDCPDMFIGLFHSGIVDKSVLLDLLRTIPNDKSVELCCHPGLPGPPPAQPSGDYEAFITSPLRRLEHDALVDPEVIDAVRKRGLTLRSFDGRAK
jgi:predicted glycoside hydrolase/deacetylase ChbG (UPF0249 family)